LFGVAISISIPSRAATRATKASPRTSKLRNWSKEAQAGDNSTTGLAPGLRAASACASRAAFSTARSSVPAISNSTWPPMTPAKEAAASPIR
jgi:hypothetical protein